MGSQGGGHSCEGWQWPGHAERFPVSHRNLRRLLLLSPSRRGSGGQHRTQVLIGLRRGRPRTQSLCRAGLNAHRSVPLWVSALRRARAGETGRRVLCSQWACFLRRLGRRNGVSLTCPPLLTVPGLAGSLPSSQVRGRLELGISLTVARAGRPSARRPPSHPRAEAPEGGKLFPPVSQVPGTQQGPVWTGRLADESAWFALSIPNQRPGGLASSGDSHGHVGHLPSRLQPGPRAHRPRAGRQGAAGGRRVRPGAGEARRPPLRTL